MPRVIIVGAGITGLTVAYRLRQLAPSIEVVLLEERSRPGGTIWTERRVGFQVEIGPNGFLDTKPSTLGLCHDLGLGDRLLAASASSVRNRYLFLDGRLRPLPAGLGAFVRSDLLSWRGKLDLFLERCRRSPKKGDDESVDAFARRRAGHEAAEVFADALVTGIHAGDPKLLSARAAFPHLTALEAEHGSVLKGLARTARQRRREGSARRPGQMWSFREGLRLLVETLAGRLNKQPLWGAIARSLQKDGHSDRAPNRWTVRAEGQDTWSAEGVVLACPAYRQAALLDAVDPGLADEVGRIAYNRIAVVALGFRAADVPGALDGFGYIAPQRTRRDVLGVQWCSSIFPDRAPPGMVLIRAMCGGWHRAEVAGWPDDRLLSAVRQELRLAMNVQADPVFHHIVRWDRAIPQYHLGHSERVTWIAERLGRHPGLFLTGNAYHGVAMNDCTEQGSVVAARVAAHLRNHMACASG
jgi:oxygen-dependent protoporphyrinogen oxidase